MLPALAEHFRLEEGNLIRIVDITPDNWRLDLKVAESQKAYVANSAVLLARACNSVQRDTYKKTK